jgi:hypothetical protein
VTPNQHSVGKPEPLLLGDFARLVYRLGRTRATGVLTVYTTDTKPDVLVLRRGHLMAADTDALGRRTRQYLARLASLESAHYTFDSGTVAYPPGAVQRQFSLAAWARSHFEAQIDAGRARALVTELSGVLLCTRPENAPEAGLCDATDLRILEALGSPQRLDQIWHHARTPRFRLLTFLHFLRCVDALESTGNRARAPRLEEWDAQDAPTDQDDGHRRVLGVSENADRMAVKRAYRRLARALHPDLHPHLSVEQRRRLERELAAVTHAYNALS